MKAKHIYFEGTPYSIIYGSDGITILNNDKVTRKYSSGDLVVFDRDSIKNLLWVAPFDTVSNSYDYIFVSELLKNGIKLSVPVQPKKFCQLNVEFDVSDIGYGSRYTISTSIEWYKSMVRVPTENRYSDIE